ncbi:glycoside hydrolase 43 family protein [Sphingomonas sp. CJ20]
MSAGAAIRRGLWIGAALAIASPAAAQVWRSDQGDGTFRNPVLYADYPDPDVIRVGSDYYFASTTFANVPGITILHSKDLVNWTLYSHVADRLEGTEKYDLKNGDGYRHGLYAASLRHRDGMFYIAVTPVGLKTRIYYSPDLKGPWKYHELDREAFDPALFLDDDGTGYLATSTTADGTITLLTLDKDLARVTDARKIHYIRGAEGSKILKRNGWYYIFNSIPPRLGMTVSRARSLFGPWETRNQIDDKTGGHQGALVDLPDGNWFGFVMVDAGSIGRMTNFSPVFWEDDWPVWGTREAPGRVPERARKPIAGFPFAEPATSDDFAQPTLGMQWQWNHNPDNARWSLTERPGFLRLRATTAPTLWSARNTLTQKGQGPRSRAVVKMDISHVRAGDRCGFGTFGQYSATIAASRGADGKPFLAMSVLESTDQGPKTDLRVARQPIAGSQLWVAVDADFTTDLGALSYSLDGARWTPLGGAFPLAFAWRTGTFQGEQFAISCFNPQPSTGYLDVDSFTLSPGKP